MASGKSGASEVMMTNRAKTLKRLMLFCAKSMGLFMWAAKKSPASLRILFYSGQLDGENSGSKPDFKTFESRLQRLHRSHFPVVSLDEAAGCLKRGDLPAHATVIMIDEEGPYSGPEALAILRHYHFPATLGPSAKWDQALADAGINIALNTGLIIPLFDGAEVDPLEFEAELTGFLDMWRQLKKKS